MKNILFVSQCDFPSNSAVHIHHFANELVTLGLDCVVAVPNNQQSINLMKSPLYKATQFNQIESLLDLFENKQPPDIVHVWTPRESVRHYCMHLEELFQFKLVIHLEDNESVLLERFYNKPMADLLQFSTTEFSVDLSHPQKYSDFVSSADGVTVIIDKLQEFIPELIPKITIWPGVDRDVFFPRSRKSELMRDLAIPENCTVLCYTGNIHPANVSEVKSLYRAVGKRNRENKQTILVRTGVTPSDFLNIDEQWIGDYVIDLGFVEREQIPELLALADVLVQPGESDAFNAYRLPSKIPEFLAMGKPVILPDTNIGKFLTHKENAIVLPVVDEVSLSEAIDLILQNPVLAKTLSDGAVAFAQSQLDWSDKGRELKAFYLQVIEQIDSKRSHQNALCRIKSWAKDLHVKLDQTQAQLEEMKSQLKACQNQIEAMQSSKFWKLRTLWFKIKSKLKGKD